VAGLIVLIGMKHCGKSTVAVRLAGMLGRPFHDLDAAMAERHRRLGGTEAGIREIYGRLGPVGFRALEFESSRELIDRLGAGPAVVALGGGLADNPEALELWRTAGLLVFLDAAEEELYRRIARNGLPPFLRGPDPRAAFHDLFLRRTAVYRRTAQISVPVDGINPGQVAERVSEAVSEFQARRSQ
jgi:shikimate kinase